MNWIKKWLGPSLTEPPLPAFLKLYADRFRLVSRIVLQIVYKNIELSVSPSFREKLRQAPRTVLYANHPSFWDPLVLALVTEALWPDRPVISPIDDKALRNHPYFRGLGFFGLRKDSVAGLRAFVRTATLLWSRSHPSCLALTPEGQFSPGQQRPLRLRRGLALALWRNRGAGLVLVPVAMQHQRHNLRRGQARIVIGEPFALEEMTAATLADLHETLRVALEATIDRLQSPADAPINLLKEISL